MSVVKMVLYNHINEREGILFMKHKYLKFVSYPFLGFYVTILLSQCAPTICTRKNIQKRHTNYKDVCRLKLNISTIF